MNGLLTKYLGASYRTSIAGAIVAIAYVVNGVLNEGQVVPSIDPMDWAGWSKFLVAIALFWAYHVSKDKNVSNAPVPGPAEKVPTIVAAPPPVGQPVIAGSPNVTENKP